MKDGFQHTLRPRQTIGEDAAVDFQPLLTGEAGFLGVAHTSVMIDDEYCFLSCRYQKF